MSYSFLDLLRPNPVAGGRYSINTCQIKGKQPKLGGTNHKSVGWGEGLKEKHLLIKQRQLEGTCPKSLA